MIAVILGSAAGGGLPQWNCGCSNCAACRAGSPDIIPRTQSSVAVSADSHHWFLLNVSPDVRQQVLRFPTLACPATCTRGTAIAGCVLTDAELDHTVGLLSLREGEAFAICASDGVRQILQHSFPVVRLLDASCDRKWISLTNDEPQELALPDGRGSGLLVRSFDVGGHSPRYATSSESSADCVVGLQIEHPDSGSRLVYAPGVASLTNELQDVVRGATCVLLDGTFWDDDELKRLGVGNRTATQMGHWPVGGSTGSLEWLKRLDVPHRMYVHINNTNPMLRHDAPQRRLVESFGVRIAADMDTVTLSSKVRL